MQTAWFLNGGFVVHKIKHVSSLCVSAWFDAEGALLDAAGADRLGRSRPIRPGSPIWERIKPIGPATVALRDAA